MEKHTCNNSIELTFYCVQPIHINNDDLIKLFDIKVSKEMYNNYTKNTIPKWFDEFNKELYSNMILLNFHSVIDNSSLVNELVDKFKVNDKLSFADNILNSDFYLIYDHKLMYFNLVFEVTLKFTTETIEQYLLQENNKKDLYNTIRSVIVKEKDNIEESIWAKNIKKASLENINMFLRDIYKYQLDKESIFIENNTGNITNIVDLSEVNSAQNQKQFLDKFITLNDKAERIKAFKKPINIDNESSVYHFNGRFHTITINDRDDIYRYVPIQFHMQYMWFYLKKINTVLENKYNKIVVEDNLKTINSNAEVVDNLINKIEILTMHNEKFKLIIEADNEKIYNKIQATWNIENMLTNSNRYINYFKDYLTRQYTKQTSKIEHKQNIILLFITMFQFAALISVWNDYLALLDDDIKNKADEIIPYFGNYANLEALNFSLPFIFFFIIVLMTMYVFKKG